MDIDKNGAIKTFKSLAEAHVQSMQDAFGATLCYDEASLFLLDDLMVRRGITPKDETFNLVIMTVGSYLGENLIRALGGRWEFDPDLEWVVEIEGEKISPFTMVIRRFTQPTSQSITDWYKEFTSNRAGEISDEDK